MEPQSSFSLFIISMTGELIAEASLTCEPAGGSHPDPDAACEQLSKVDGRIEDIPEDEGFCTLEFAPTLVAAVGTWRGESRFFARWFDNRCFAIRGTGGVVFDFDSLD